MIKHISVLLATCLGCPCAFGGLDEYLAEHLPEEWFSRHCHPENPQAPVECWKEVLTRMTTQQRIDKDTYYLNIAKAVAARSTCLHRQYGTVIVNNDEIIATGYNGAPRGEANCCDVGKCYRDCYALPLSPLCSVHGSQYGSCVAVHAEQNAIISAARKDMQGATLYLASLDDSITPVPCNICDRMIKNAGITKVITSLGQS